MPYRAIDSKKTDRWGGYNRRSFWVLCQTLSVEVRGQGAVDGIGSASLNRDNQEGHSVPSFAKSIIPLYEMQCHG